MYRRRYSKKQNPPGKREPEKEIEDRLRPEKKMGRKRTARSRESGESVSIGSGQRRWIKRARIKKMRQGFKQGKV